MKHIFSSVLAAIILGTIATAPVHAASNQAMVELCLLALETDKSSSTDANFRFKSVKGASLKRLKFVMTDGDIRKNVTCKIKGGEVVALDWPTS